MALVSLTINIPEDLDALLSEIAEKEEIPKSNAAKRMFLDGFHIYLAQLDRGVWRKFKAARENDQTA